jgi:hypothetical protein
MPVLVRALGTWVRLPAGERRLVASATLLMAVMPMALTVCSLRRLLPGTSTGRRAASPSERRIAHLVHATATVLPWTPSCLTRALVVAHLVARHGGSCTLVLGVRRPSEGFAAHAWIEVDGELADPLPIDTWHPLARWSIPTHGGAAPSCRTTV